MTWGFPGPAAAKGRPVTNIRNLDSPFWRSALEQCRAALHRPGDALLRMDRRARPGDQAQAQGVVRAHPHEERRSRLFAFAGLWRPGEGGPYHGVPDVRRRTRLVGAVHPKAMPVMLRPADALGVARRRPRESACALAQPFADADMRIIDTA